MSKKILTAEISWVPIRLQEPPENVEILLWSGGLHHAFIESGYVFQVGSGDCLDWGRMTHWAAIPEGPQG